jgi:hypothetical protein
MFEFLRLRSRLWQLFVAWAAVAALSIASVPCRADDAEGNSGERSGQETARTLISGVDVGIAGVYKNGFRTQIVVALGEATPKTNVVLELETRDTDGAPFVVSRQPTSEELASGKAELSFFLPKASEKLTVRVIGGAKIVDEQTFAPGSSQNVEANVAFEAPASPAKPIYLVVGDDKLGFPEAFGELRLKEERRPAIIKIDSLDQLPTDYRSYEAVDRLFLTTTDVSLYDGYNADSPRLAAIEKWVQTGGSVVILAGKDSVPLLSDGGVLANLSPGQSVLPRTHEFRTVNAFTSDLQNVKNLLMGTRSNPFLQTPVLSELKDGANVEMREFETPLLVTRAVGFGSTIFFAADLAEAPISNWSGRGRLLLKILGLDPDAPSGQGSLTPSVNRGYVDYSGQIRSALDRFDGVRPTSFALIATLLLFYVIVIAPLDWLVAKKLLKRPMVTWATFPIFVIVFIAIAVGILRARTPNEATFNQLDLFDVDLASGSARNFSWFGVYSPTGDRYDVQYHSALSCLPMEGESDVDITPLPLSGSALGGAEQKSFMPRLWEEPYRLEEGVIRYVPSAPRSSKSFVGRWTGKASELPPAPELSDDGLSLRGSIVNPFDVPIYSAYVVYKGGACALGTLPPGETRIERGAARLEPKRVINEHRSSVPTALAEKWDATNYNSSSVRLPYILRSATFYDYAGGVDAFGIEKRLQRDVDLSALLRCGRAVVYGVVVDPFYEEYKPTKDIVSVSTDSIQLERLNKKLAEKRGETYRDQRLETLERYGIYGTSPEFVASEASISRSRESESVPRAAAKRTVVTRLIVPIRFGTHRENEE